MEERNDNQLGIGELPHLEILPISKVMFHEECDPERAAKLAENMRKENKLKNPPVVARHPENGGFILLDGANRLTGLTSLGIPDVLAQVIDLYHPGLSFITWHHAVEKFSKSSFLESISRIPEVVVTENHTGILTLEADGLVCQIQFADGSIYGVRAHADLEHKVQDLHRITEIYHSFAYMDRVSYTNLEHLKHNYTHFCCVIAFTRISKEELVRLTRDGRKVPSGITRIILPKRALRVNVPLDILRFEVPLEQKNHWLQRRITEQIQDKSIRFYHEPTFLFDE